MSGRRCSKKRDTERSPVSELTDDLLVEIISRVPFKSTCCCKCITTRWRDLVSDIDHRKKLPRSTLAGFFYQSSGHTCYRSVSGNWCLASTHASLSFYSRCGEAQGIFLLDCCNGLLLGRPRMCTDRMATGYIVCNPATEKWVAVPASGWSREVCFTRLAFDPEVSSRFHVLQFASGIVLDADTKGDGIYNKALRIYLSKTGSWTHPLVWQGPMSLFSVKGIFFMGLLYLSSVDGFVVAVGMEGNNRAIPVPYSARGDHNLHLSQGQLHLAIKGVSELSIWTLEDSNNENWILKHNVSHLQLLGTEYSMFADGYKVISIHPESNVTFILCESGYQSERKLMSYEMDSRKLSFICDIEWDWTTPFPYVPLFSNSFASGN